MIVFSALPLQPFISSTCTRTLYVPSVALKVGVCIVVASNLAAPEPDHVVVWNVPSTLRLIGVFSQTSNPGSAVITGDKVSSTMTVAFARVLLSQPLIVCDT